MTDTLARVKKIVAEQLEVGEDEVVPSASFEDLGADSLDQIELIESIQKEFGLKEIADGEVAQIITVQDAVDYIHEHAK